MPVRDLRQRLQIADVAGRVPHAFAEQTSRAIVDQLLHRGGLIVLGKANLDPEFRQNVREQRVRRAVELRDGDQVRAGLHEIEHGKVQRRLSRAHAERVQPALELGHAPFEDVRRGVAYPRIAVARYLEIEQGRAVLGAVELVRCRLIDRHRRGLRRGIHYVAALNRDRLSAHLATTSHLAQSCNASRASAGHFLKSRPCVANSASTSRSKPNATHAV